MLEPHIGVGRDPLGRLHFRRRCREDTHFLEDIATDRTVLEKETGENEQDIPPQSLSSLSSTTYTAPPSKRESFHDEHLTLHSCRAPDTEQPGYLDKTPTKPSAATIPASGARSATSRAAPPRRTGRLGLALADGLEDGVELDVVRIVGLKLRGDASEAAPKGVLRGGVDHLGLG